MVAGKLRVAALLMSMAALVFLAGCNGGYYSETIYETPAPSGLTATAGNAQVTLNWTAPSAAGAAARPDLFKAPLSYNLYWSTTSGVTPANGTRISGITGTTYVQTGLTNGTAYYYVVTAVYSSGESAPSNQAAATPLAPIPSAPLNLAATAGNAQVSLTWTASANAATYNLYWSTTTGVTPANGTKISGITSANYIQTGLTNGTTYFYVVTAVDASGESPASNQASATPVAPVPAAPLNLKATAGNAQVSLTWSASSGAASYNLYWSTTAGVTPANGTKISGITSPSYVQTGLTNGTTYFYVVTAANASGESAASNQASATPVAPIPPAPLNLQATAGDAQVTLAWSASAGAVTYNLYWSTTSGVTPANGAKIAGITSPSYVQTGLTNGTTYYYVVTAVDTGGESGPSNQASATPAASSLPAPTLLTATGGAGDVSLTWTASTGASSYNIYYSTTAGVTPANGSRISAVTGTTYVVPSLTACVPYYFVVTAVSGSTESSASNQASATPNGAATVALTPGTAASVTLQADTSTSLTFNFPANAVTQAVTANLSPLTASQLPVPFTSSVGTFLAGYGMCFSPGSVSTLNAPVTISGSVGDAVASGTGLNLGVDQSSSLQVVATFQVGASGTLTEGIPSVNLPGALSAGSYALYQPATGTSTSVANFGVAILADDGVGVNHGVQFIYLYDSSGNLLATPTMKFVPYDNSTDLDGQAITPDGTEGIIVDGGNNILFFSELQTGNPTASSDSLDITSYGGDGDSVVILPNGDEAVATGDNIAELPYITGILSGSPVIASTVSIPGATEGIDGLVMSNDGKVLLARKGVGTTVGVYVLAVTQIAPTAGSLAGTVTHSFTVEPLAGTPIEPFFEDGRDGMAISPADSSRGVLIGASDENFDNGAIQMLTGMPMNATAQTPVDLPATACSYVDSVAISPDGKLAAVGCLSGLVLFSGVDTGNLTQVGGVFAPTYTVGCPTSYGGCTGNMTTTLAGGTSGIGVGITTLGFTLDGKYLVAGDLSNYAIVVIPVSASGFGAPASALGNVAIPFNDQMVVH